MVVVVESRSWLVVDRSSRLSDESRVGLIVEKGEMEGDERRNRYM